MNRFFSNLLTASLTLSLSAISSFPISVSAATINYDFKVAVDSGPLNGKNYTGSFSYEDTTFNLNSLNFSFNGTNYTKANDSNAKVEFNNGNFLGLSFNPNPTLSLVPGFFDVSEAYLAYDIDTPINGAGFGSVIYTKRQTPTTTPETVSVFSLIALGVLAKSSLKNN